MTKGLFREDAIVDVFKMVFPGGGQIIRCDAGMWGGMRIIRCDAGMWGGMRIIRREVGIRGGRNQCR